MAIIVSGIGLGRLKLKGVGLGTSGVLFTALLFGHLHGAFPGSVAGLPEIVGSIGIVFFVYSVGLQAGPRFFKTFRAHGRHFVLLGLCMQLSAVLVAFVVAMVLGLRPAVAAGMFAGALTSTPGLAAAIDVLKDPEVSVAYGLVYPFSVAVVVVFVQLLPRLIRLDMKAASEAAERVWKGPSIAATWFEVRNPNCAGRTIADLGFPGISGAILSRLKRGDAFYPVMPDTRLELGDAVKAAGSASDQLLLETIFGPRIAEGGINENLSDFIAREVFVSNPSIVGKTLAELALNGRYGLVLTRLWRQDIEFLPRGQMTLESGDLVRVVGPRPNVMRFIADFGTNDRRLNETDFFPLGLGMLAGLGLGMYPFSIGGMEFKLGLAGGPLFVALVAAHFGRIGAFSIRVPEAARWFTRELGLMLFLASAGVKAGEHLLPILRESGVQLIVAAIFIKLVPLTLGWWLTRWQGVEPLSALGLLCGAVTSTPGLGAVSANAQSEAPALAYATVYPSALIGMLVFTQLLCAAMLGLAAP